MENQMIQKGKQSVECFEYPLLKNHWAREIQICIAAFGQSIVCTRHGHIG
jgi:hypothetical protein